jgi:hypothetical protein
MCTVVVVGHKGIITYYVTLGAFNVDKFVEFFQRQMIIDCDKQSFILMDNVRFCKSCEIQVVKEASYIYFRMLTYSWFLNAGKLVLGHVKTQVQWNDLQNNGTI